MHILTKKYKDVDLVRKQSLAGEFRLVVRGPDGEVRRDTGWFDNLILDSGLNRWGTGAVISGVAIGTSSDVPDASQTGLQAQAAWTTSSQGLVFGNSGVSPYYGTVLVTYRFAIGSLNNNYTEVGVGWASGANMFSRALILDQYGLPTTLSVGLTEQLDVVYRLRCYVPLTDDTKTGIVIGAQTIDIVTRASVATIAGWGCNTSASKNAALNPLPGGLAENVPYLGYTGGDIGSITSIPTGAPISNGGQYGFTTATNPTYVNNSLAAGLILNSNLSNQNAAGGIKAVRITYTGGERYQYGFTPPIAKDATQTMVLRTSITWGRF